MSKKAIEYIPSPQGEFTEADYYLGVLACAFSTRTTLAGQVCVASDDSTLGGYCMEDKSGFAPINFCDCYYREGVIFCSTTPEKVPYNTCELETRTGLLLYLYGDSDGSLYSRTKCYFFDDSAKAC